MTIAKKIANKIQDIIEAELRSSHIEPNADIRVRPSILQLANEEEGMAWAHFAANASRTRDSIPEACERADNLLLAYRARRVETSESAVCTCEGFLEAREGLHLAGCPAKERQTYVEQLETLNSHYCEEADKIDELIGRKTLEFGGVKPISRIQALKHFIDGIAAAEANLIVAWLREK